MTNKIPELENSIENLRNKISKAKWISWAYQVYKKWDPEGNSSIGTKQLIKDISGFAKFDTEKKITKN